MLQYLKNKDSKQTDIFLTPVFQRFAKYPEHTREVYTEDAASGTFFQGPGTTVNSKAPFSWPASCHGSWKHNS